MGIIGTVREYAQRMGVDVVRYKANRAMIGKALQQGRFLALLKALPDGSLRKAIDLSDDMKSQLGQDIFALVANDFKREGFFVEFGATDGETLSNTWLLEKKFGWTGILAEPARVWHRALDQNRSVAIEHECVWSETGETLVFSEVPREAELSTVSSLVRDDRHAASRSDTREYTVRTIAFNDLLERHNAPAVIDFLSIDTEGSELQILNSLAWDRWRFRAIACEHNFTENRAKIAALLGGLGYQRVFEDVSDFDDWYVLRESALLST